MPTARTAFGITYYAYSLHDWRALRSPLDIPRAHWPILRRAATNYQLANRYDARDGAIPQLGGVDHIGAGFQDNTAVDLGAERLTEYGLNPSNTRASYNASVDSNTICLLAPPDTRPWQHGVSGSPVDMNSLGLGIEDGILSTNWDALPEPKRTAHYRMRAAWWALWFGYKRWPLIYTPNRARVFELAGRGESWGLTQHGDIDPQNRSDAGYVWAPNGRRNTFDYDRLFAMIREEMAIRTGAIPGTPTLPDPNEGFPAGHVEQTQRTLNDVFGYTLDVDGRLGPLTRTAVEEVQDFLGLKVDGLPGPLTTTAMEEAMSKLDELTAKVTDLPARVLAAPFPLSALAKKSLGTESMTVAQVLDHTLRRAQGAWSYSHRAMGTSRAVATRLEGLEATVVELAKGNPSIDQAAVRSMIDQAVGRYELTLNRVEDENPQDEVV